MKEEKVLLNYLRFTHRDKKLLYIIQLTVSKTSAITDYQATNISGEPRACLITTRICHMMT